MQRYIWRAIEVVITRTTRNRLIGVEPVRGFESHALRHVGASSVSLAPIFYASQKKRSALTPLLLLSKPKQTLRFGLRNEITELFLL